MANGTKAIERNEVAEILVYRRSVSNRLRLRHAFAGWLRRLQLDHRGEVTIAAWPRLIFLSSALTSSAEAHAAWTRATASRTSRRRRNRRQRLPHDLRKTYRRRPASNTNGAPFAAIAEGDLNLDVLDRGASDKGEAWQVNAPARMPIYQGREAGLIE